MRLSAERADALLHVEKRIVSSGVIDLRQSKTRMMLVAENNSARFMFEFSRTCIELKKVSYHMQLDKGIGLTRFDFGGGHNNPRTTDGAPEVAKPFVGKRFVNESHIHVYSPDCQLDWAVPPDALEIRFGTKPDGSCDIRQVLDAFCEYIALRDKIIILGALHE